MKTAISVPDDVYHRVTQLAAALGVSRSELFSRAARRFLDHTEQDTITAQIDAALQRLGEDGSAAVAVSAGRARLTVDDGEW